MDLQTAFYTIGLIYFAVVLVMALVIGWFLLSLYFRYRTFVKKTRRRVEKMKEVVPFLSYLMGKINEKKARRRDYDPD